MASGRRLISRAVVATVAVAALVGCSSDGESSSTTDSAPTTDSITETTPATTPSSTDPATSDAITTTTAASTPTDASTAPTSSAPSSSTPPSSDTPTTLGGGINVTVPNVSLPVADPVPFDDDADFGDGLVARIGEVEGIETTSQIPGEVGGASVSIEVIFENTSDEAIELNTVIVDLVLADGRSAQPLTTDPAKPVSGSVAPGATALGLYVFTVAPEQRGDVTLTVTHSTAAPTVVFTGSVA